MDRYVLGRFVEAQETVIEAAMAELRQGRKRSHWMWFVFPQVAGLGQSPTSRMYAIGGLDEARAYLAHPLLGERLRHSVRILLDLPSTDAEAIFGPIDAIKLRSSLTLFHRAAPNEPLFAEALHRCFDGSTDPMTDRLLG